MMRLPRCIATDALRLLALCALLLTGAAAWAASVAGTVTHLSGPLVAKKADGSVRVLAIKSQVEEGDLLVTEKTTYARVRFIDDSEMTLKPSTQLKVEGFAYDAGKQEDDKANFNLIKGGLRAVTGALGKRSKERFSLSTPTATIGIRGTIFIADYVPPDAEQTAAWLNASMASADGGMAIAPLQLAQANVPPAPPASPSGLAPGLYLQVLDGMVVMSNRGGTLNFSAGQFGYVPSLVTPPILVPANPGLQFTPPPAFTSQGPAGPNGPAGATPPANAVDCVVR